MFKVKLKYKKGEEVKYISHRDLMRVFQRAIRRAKLPITFSQGFNPHMKISWGQALKVGAMSDGEPAELQFEAWINPKEVMQRLNQVLPLGLEIIEAHVI